MAKRRISLWRHLLPWLISAAALGYVFGYAIDWESLPEATENANVPLFILVIVLDKIGFFLAWAFIQAKSVRDLVEPISVRSLISVKGAAELLRTGSNLLSDGAFLLGVSQIVKDRLAAVFAVIVVPFAVYFFVLLCQATLVLPFLPGGPSANLDVAFAAGIGWLAVIACVAAGRMGYWERFLRRIGRESWIGRATLARLLPLFGCFAAFAAFDVAIQGLASRAFGIPIPWIDLAGRIPLLYVAISLPSFGNFGVREIAWSSLFAEYGSREGLIAYALYTNAIFAGMHVVVGSLFIGRALSLWRQLREERLIELERLRLLEEDAEAETSASPRPEMARMATPGAGRSDRPEKPERAASAPVRDGTAAPVLPDAADV